MSFFLIHTVWHKDNASWLLIASYSIAQFFGSPILGALSDKYGRKKSFLIAARRFWDIYYSALHFCSTTFCCLPGNHRRVCRRKSVNNVIYADLSDEKSKAKNFGLVGMAFGLGFIFGPFIGEARRPNAGFCGLIMQPLWFASLLRCSTY